MSVKLFDNHPHRCEYCLHARLAEGRIMCVRRRAEVSAPCTAFVYDPLKRVPRQEARLPEYRPEDFLIGDGGEDLDNWRQDQE